MELPGKTILLAEDDNITALNQKRWLVQEGFNIIHVSSGEDAVSKVRENPEQINLILMDIDLGPGIDGTEAAREILKAYDLPIIFISSHSEKEIVDKTEAITSYGYVVKGSDKTVILASIKMAFRLFEANRNLKLQTSARTKSDAELVYSFNLLKYFITHARTSIAIFDREMKYLYVSERFLEEYKVKEKDIIGKYHYDVFPGIPDKWKRVHQMALKGIVSSSEEDQFPKPDGSFDWVRWECRPWHESDGSIGGIILNAEVITGRINARETLEKYALIFKNVKWGIVAGNVNSNAVEICNQEYARMHGYTMEEIRRRKTIEFYPPEASGLLNEKIREINEKGFVSFESEHIRKDGSRFPVQIDATIISDESGKPVFRVANLLDITEKKKIEAKLKESESTFSSAFNNAAIGLVITSPAGQLLKVNSSLCRMIGFTEEELLNKSIKDITHHEDYDMSREYIIKLVSGEIESYHIEKRYLHKSGKPIWGLLSVSGVRSENNEIQFLIGQVQDITARKEAERRIAEYNEKLEASNREKEMYISILAHDLRGPVSGFVGLSEELAANAGKLTNGEMVEYAGIMYESAKRVQSLLLNLLEWSGLHLGNEEFEFEKFLLREEAENVISLYLNSARKKSLNIINEISHEAAVCTYKKVIETVMRNLISNAVKFSAPGGIITISSELQTDSVEIRIADNGVGIEPEKLQKIFSLGSGISTKGTGNESGSGLGLVLCHDLLVKNNGRISAESTPGKGTTFTFSLPVL